MLFKSLQSFNIKSTQVNSKSTFNGVNTQQSSNNVQLLDLDATAVVLLPPILGVVVDAHVHL